MFLILPPLLVAQWAYRQYAEEFKGHERALHVLVAAVEAKAPHLAGHSTRVAELSASMAEHLGLRAQVVADARVAGMLHDLGLTTLPTGLVRSTGVVGGARAAQLPGARGPPAAGAQLPVRGARRHRPPPRRVSRRARPTRGDLSVPALVVGLADEFDLLTEVGTPDGALVTKDEALAAPAAHPGGSRGPHAGPRARAVAGGTEVAP